MSKPTVIALTYASIGSGHKVAAQAIEEAFATRYPEVETHLVDVLEYGARKVDGDLLTRSFAGPTGPIYDVVWDNVTFGRLTWTTTGWFTRRFYAAFTAKLCEIGPDVVVATHAMGANIAVGSRIKLAREILRESDLVKDIEEALPGDVELLSPPPKKDFLTVGIPTDYGINASWPGYALDLMCVGGPELRDDLLARNVPSDHIAITGIPTHAAFGAHTDKHALRDRLGLPRDKRIAVALAGASMPGPYVTFKKYLNYALPDLCAHKDVALAVVTGKDSEYEAELRALAGTPGYENLYVFGFVDDMAALMGAADMLVCKPGGLTCTEGIRSGLPLLLVGHAMGQERVNVDFLEPRNIARHVLNDRELVEEFDAMINHEATLSAMQQATCAFRTFDSAEAVATQVMNLLSP